MEWLSCLEYASVYLTLVASYCWYLRDDSMQSSTASSKDPISDACRGTTYTSCWTALVRKIADSTSVFSPSTYPIMHTIVQDKYKQGSNRINPVSSNARCLLCYREVLSMLSISKNHYLHISSYICRILSLNLPLAVRQRNEVASFLFWNISGFYNYEFIGG